MDESITQKALTEGRAQFIYASERVDIDAGMFHKIVNFWNFNVPQYSNVL
jgi:hypothetical protein